MPTDHIVSLLIAERDKLNRAIEALSSPVKRSSRPPKKPSIALEPDSSGSKKRHVSAAARRRMAIAQKKRWAALKAAK
jgi:hypothetical protein